MAATIGNVLEGFDFVVYGFFAVTIAEVFFPASNPTVSLLITFGTFGLGYVVRPLGAVIIGTYSDRAGRKAGLTLSIGLMLIGTTLMVITPSYAAEHGGERRGFSASWLPEAQGSSRSLSRCSA
jgi:MFS transporter, MHS family, proline/betaine transporter